MRVLFVTSELFPLAKTGGLADVAAALPAALQDLGVDVRVILPAYPCALERASGLKEIMRLGDPLGWGETRLLETFMPDSSVPVWLVDCPDLYNRSGGLYQDHDGCDWPDNHLRFALLGHVAAGIALEAGGAWRPDIVHANDWHAGLIPLLISQHGPKAPASVFTVHNLAYQGAFQTWQFEQLGLPPEAMPSLRHYDGLSFLKAGILSADAITTVSPTYAREILTPEHGCGLDGLLRERATRLSGILNGADYRLWDPAADPHLVRNYSPRSLAGKCACRRAIEDEFGLDTPSESPLVAFMSRLAHQKMPDVVLEALPALLGDGMHVAVLADGERKFQRQFRQLADAFPGQVAVRIGYDERCAHRLLAGADILLHPSRFEPCGLLPVYAMRYGTVPVVRGCGGLKDTVADPGISQRDATGFSFGQPTASEMIACVRRALELYRQPVAWRRMMAAGMRKDFGWHRSAQAYLDLYTSLARVSAVTKHAEERKAERRSA